MKEEKQSYNKIEVLKGLETIRKNSGMYVGSCETNEGLEVIFREVLDNSIDEFLNDFGKLIKICLHTDGSCSIQDEGRGIPVAWNKEEKKSSLELAVSQIHAGGKFNKENYKYSGGLHGVGAVCTNALSARFKVIVWRDGKEYSMIFERGKKVQDLEEKPIRGNKTGTLIRFIPDNQVFKNIVYDPDRIRTRLRELSFLCDGLTIEFIDEKNNTKDIFPGETNIVDFIKYLAKDAPLIAEPLLIKCERNNIVVSIALQWKDDASEEETCKCFTNNINNLDEGSHGTGFRSALTKSINNYISSADLPKNIKGMTLTGDAIREGIVAIVNILHPDPKFTSQTKTKLVSEDARFAVESITAEYLTFYLEQNPAISKKIISRCVNAFKAREAARRAKETFRKTAISGGGIILPGKLADASCKDPDRCELFICEGASAGGGLKQARNRETQAIYPMRGKILNIEKSEYKSIIKNEELMNITTALGTNLGRNFDISKLRYAKICFCCDADVDGLHIRTLLLTFFYRQMPQLILNGNVYISLPPLYRIDYRGTSYYIRDEKALGQFIKEKKVNQKTLKIQRFKGLGEMGIKSLAETVLEPITRQLLQVKIDDYVETDKIFQVLMGENVEIRRQFIMNNSNLATKLDI